MILARWAVIKAETPPDAPAKHRYGEVNEVTIDPAATPAIYTRATRHQRCTSSNAMPKNI